MPSVAKEHTDQGATAFAKYYWNVGGEAVETSDTTTLRSLFSDECAVCATLARSIDGYKAKDQHADRNPTTVDSAEIAPTTDGKSDEAVRLEVTDAEHYFVDANGKKVGRVEKEKYTAIVYLNWEAGTWTVVDSFLLV